MVLQRILLWWKGASPRSRVCHASISITTSILDRDLISFKDFTSPITLSKNIMLAVDWVDPPGTA